MRRIFLGAVLIGSYFTTIHTAEIAAANISLLSSPDEYSLSSVWDVSIVPLDQDNTDLTTIEPITLREPDIFAHSFSLYWKSKKDDATPPLSPLPEAFVPFSSSPLIVYESSGKSDLQTHIKRKIDFEDDKVSTKYSNTIDVFCTPAIKRKDTQGTKKGEKRIQKERVKRTAPGLVEGSMIFDKKILDLIKVFCKEMLFLKKNSPAQRGFERRLLQAMVYAYMVTMAEKKTKEIPESFIADQLCYNKEHYLTDSFIKSREFTVPRIIKGYELVAPSMAAYCYALLWKVNLPLSDSDRSRMKNIMNI